MALVEIKFAPWTGRASLNVEVGDDVEPRFRLRAALQIEVGKARDKGRGADLSGAVLSGAALLRAVLRDADLRGAVLRGAVLSGAVLRGAVLSGADLSGAVLSDAVLSDAVLRGADLSGAVLSGAALLRAVLRDADLSGADLSGAVLSGADLSGAVLSGVPKIENIDATILAAIEDAQKQGGGLDMGSWHTCDTTHCRAGWAVHLAGPAGAALEFAMGTAGAGTLIYAASSPDKKIPNFYATNEDAMRDMRERAGFENASSHSKQESGI